MKKIPTLFVRDPDDMRHVTRDVHPDCQWVIDGEGTATRKYDGTCVMFDGKHWWARREVKPGKTPPAGWVQVDHDDTTGKSVGWEPIEQSAFYRLWKAAFETDPRYDGIGGGYTEGTYELVGPRVNGNPESLNIHTLIRHADAAVLDGVPRTYDELAVWMPELSYEGIVWHHPDGRMAKLKRRDFPPATVDQP